VLLTYICSTVKRMCTRALVLWRLCGGYGMASLSEEHPPSSAPGGAAPQTEPGSSVSAQQIEAEQTRLLYAQAPTGFVVTLLNSALVAVVLRHEVAPLILFSWVALMTVVTLSRFVLVLWYRRAAPAADRVRYWRTRFILGASGAGLVWGAAGI